MFDLPDEAKTASDPLKGTKSAIQLPFAAPELWWYNGKPELSDTEEIKDPRRFGGFGISADEFQEMLDKLPPIPETWRLFENLRNGDGKTYSAYLTRVARIAPIARRWRWVNGKDFHGSQLNVLGYLAITDKDKRIIPWGPVVITGKRYSGQAIDDALRSFESATHELRGETPSRFFYIPIGTFEKAPRFEQRKGKQGKSSSITPCQLFKPEKDWDTPMLEMCFVGKEIALKCLDIEKQAQEWVKDWAKPKAQPTEYEEEAPMPEEENPF